MIDTTVGKESVIEYYPNILIIGNSVQPKQYSHKPYHVFVT